MKSSNNNYAKGGDLRISKEDYFLVVQNWVYFTFNYPMGFVKDAFNSNHLEEKFSSFEISNFADFILKINKYEPSKEFAQSYYSQVNNFILKAKEFRM